MHHYNFFFKIDFKKKNCFFYNHIADVERTEEVENLNDKNQRDGYREQGLLLNVIIFISIYMFIIINFIISLHAAYSKHY